MNKKIQLLFCVVIIASLVMVACGTQPASPTPTATLVPAFTSTATIVPTSTYTPTPTFTPTVTSTVTPIPLHPITLSNASQITQIYSLGYGTIRDSAWSPDGQLLMLASSRGIYVFDMQAFWKDKKTLALKQFIECPNLTAIAISPKGDIFVTGSGDGSVQVWRVSDFSVIYSFEGVHKNKLGKNRVTVVEFSPQGDILVSGGRDGYVNVWKMIDGKLDKTISAFASQYNDYGVMEVTFSLDGSLIYVGGSGSGMGVKIFDLARGGQKRYAEITSSGMFAFSPARGLLAASFYYGTDALTLYDINTLKVIGPLAKRGGFGDSISIETLAFSPDGSILASGDHDYLGSPIHKDGNVTLWDTSTRQSTVTLPIQRSSIALLSFSPNGTILVTGGGSGLNLWNTKDGQLLASLNEFASIRGTSFTETGKMVTVSQDGKISIWDILSNTILKQSELGGRIIDLAFIQREKKLAITTSLGVQVWTYNDNEVSGLGKLETSDAALVDIVGVDGSDYLAYSLDSIGNVKLVDIGLQKEIASFFYQLPAAATSMKISPDGKMIAVGGGDWGSGRTEVWDAQTSSKLKVLGCNGFVVWKVQFSPDSTLLAEACGDETTLQRPLKGSIVWSAKRMQWIDVATVAFSPDGTVLASGDYEGKIMLWNVATGEKLVIIDGHFDKINSLVFSEDGTMLVSGSEDGTVKVWGIP
jgi:WD40 repeat protein